MESMCPRCFSVFNYVERYLVILPCGDGICLTCYDELLQNTSEGSKQGSSKLQCPMDNETLTINHKFKENLKIIRRNFNS